MPHASPTRTGAGPCLTQQPQTPTCIACLAASSMRYSRFSAPLSTRPFCLRSGTCNVGSSHNGDFWRCALLAHTCEGGSQPIPAALQAQPKGIASYKGAASSPRGAGLRAPQTAAALAARRRPVRQQHRSMLSAQHVSSGARGHSNTVALSRWQCVGRRCQLPLATPDGCPANPYLLSSAPGAACCSRTLQPFAPYSIQHASTSRAAAGPCNRSLQHTKAYNTPAQARHTRLFELRPGGGVLQQEAGQGGQVLRLRLLEAVQH